MTCKHVPNLWGVRYIGPDLSGDAGDGGDKAWTEHYSKAYLGKDASPRPTEDVGGRWAVGPCFR